MYLVRIKFILFRFQHVVDAVRGQSGEFRGKTKVRGGRVKLRYSQCQFERTVLTGRSITLSSCFEPIRFAHSHSLLLICLPRLTGHDAVRLTKRQRCSLVKLSWAQLHALPSLPLQRPRSLVYPDLQRQNMGQS